MGRARAVMRTHATCSSDLVAIAVVPVCSVADYRNDSSGIVVKVDERRWTFLSNHGHVLVCLAGDPESRLRDVAERVGITERAAQQIVRDLEVAGYVVKERVGRRNRYVVVRSRRLRHRLEHQVRIGELVDLVVDHDGSSPSA